MPFGGLLSAGILGGTSLLSGLFGSSAATKASQQQIAAIQQAIEAAKGQTSNANSSLSDWYNKNIQQLSPYLSLGQTGATQLANLSPFAAPNMADVANTPEYQFAEQQGTKATQDAMAASGGAMGGGAAKSLSQFNQGLASQQYQNAYNNALSTYGTNLNKIMGEVVSGQQSASQAASMGAQVGSQTSGNYMNLADLLTSAYTGQGNAKAAGTVGSANAWTGALSGGANTLASLYGNLYGPNGGYQAWGSTGNPQSQQNPAVLQQSGGSYTGLQ